MSIAAVFAFEHGHFARLSWWDYHAYLLAGFGAAVYAVLHKGRQQHELADVLATAFVDDPFTHIVQGYPEALSTLVRAVEMKDAYTHGHSQRTAELAVELGLRMGLPPDRLRVIARGAYLHDLGKIAIPDAISLMGFGNRDVTEVLDLTTVDQVPRDIGVEAGLLTADILEETRPFDTHVELPTQIIPRRSTAAPKETRESSS